MLKENLFGPSMFSILIPSIDNFEYLKLTIKSLIKNSEFNHEIIVFLSSYKQEHIDILNGYKIIIKKSQKKTGLCTAVNHLSNYATKDYVVYAHDDMYFCPRWDAYLLDEIKLIKDDKFYLSSTLIEPYSGGQIFYNFGEDAKVFDEVNLLKKYNDFDFPDVNGSNWAPHVISKKTWDRVGGFSEEFDPGPSSDPDLNMKLWNIGNRIFKGVSKSRVYHFGSIATKKNNIKRNLGNKKFILKWGFKTKFFIKHFMKSGNNIEMKENFFNGPLPELNKNFIYYVELFLNKLNFFYYLIFKKN